MLGSPGESPHQLAIFDCDGVLVDSEAISCGVLAMMLSAQGLPTTLAQARRDYQGLLLSEVLTTAQERLGRALPAGWLDEYEREREAVFRRELRAVAGAAQAVASVRAAGIAVCVASQGKLAKTQLSLELTGLRELFADRALFSAESVAHGKPHPDLFLYAARTMGVPPGRCAVVEDTPSGVTAAVAADMRAIGYAADSDARALADAGAELIDSLAELPGRLLTAR
ncbi:MAG TPA: HAD-IA family hydrolase [Solirubrobacteraceae bacterium]|nr:HAD-IA family hydrolase [Solirubrobacteraceae bacterium]